MGEFAVMKAPIAGNLGPLVLIIRRKGTQEFELFLPALGNVSQVLTLGGRLILLNRVERPDKTKNPRNSFGGFF